MTCCGPFPRPLWLSQSHQQQRPPPGAGRSISDNPTGIQVQLQSHTEDSWRPPWWRRARRRDHSLTHTQAAERQSDSGITALAAVPAPAPEMDRSLKGPSRRSDNRASEGQGAGTLPSEQRPFLLRATRVGSQQGEERVWTGHQGRW